MPVTYTDRSIMPFGKLHKGKQLIDVPADYMLYIYDLPNFDRQSALGRYITYNMDVLKQQARTDKQLKR